MDTLFIIRLVILISGTILFLYLSKRSLKSSEYHGFYRFFVFEITLILILLNIPHWFENPWSLPQVISWILLIYSILLLGESIYFFRKYGGSKERRQYQANFKFEDTSTLITVGIYKYIRHPMYGSLLFLSAGAMLKLISLLSLLLLAASLVFVMLTAKAEEKENIEFFGSEYEGYMKKTKMFVPYLF